MHKVDAKRTNDIVESILLSAKHCHRLLMETQDTRIIRGYLGDRGCDCVGRRGGRLWQPGLTGNEANSEA